MIEPRADVEVPVPWLVLMDRGDGKRQWVRVALAYGPYDARNQARDKYPGWVPLKERPETTAT